MDLLLSQRGWEQSPTQPTTHCQLALALIDHWHDPETVNRNHGERWTRCANVAFFRLMMELHRIDGKLLSCSGLRGLEVRTLVSKVDNASEI